MAVRCESQLDVLKQNIEDYIWTFRWVWLINLAAIIYGSIERHYDVVAFAAASALVAIVGIARARRGRRLVARAENVCLPKQKPEPESGGS